jgi:outer membrane protein insertion porin family
MKKLILLLFLLIVNFDKANSDIIKNIVIEGNKRIVNETILEIIDFKKNYNYSNEEINLFQKKLFQTNFFKTINIDFNNNLLKIKVDENPIIDFFSIPGVKNKKRENDIYDAISLGQNKIFSQSLLLNDIQKITEIYQSKGFYNVIVTPKISELSNNRVNVVFDILRNSKINIKNIFFIGEKYFSSSDLSSVVSSSRYGWWKFLSSSGTINENRLEYDKNLLRKFYINEGFYDIQILSTDYEINESDNSADITFSINSGPIYNFGKTSISDESLLLREKDKNNLKKIISDEINGKYSQKKIEKLKENIEKYLEVNNVEFTGFSLEEKKDLNNKITLDISFKKLPRQYVKQIKVTGNSITEESVIRRNLIFAEGDALTKSKLQKSINNLKDTQLFKDVKYNLVTLSDNDENINLNINVEEQPTGSISAGVGIGSSSSSINSGIEEKNLFGKGINLNSSISIGTDKVSGKTNVSIPDYKNSGNTLNSSLYVVSTDLDNAGYESTAVGSASSLQFELFENLSLVGGAEIQRDKISTNSTASSLYKSREGNYMTYKGFYNVIADERNKKFQTTDGHVYKFGQALAVPGSDIPYVENNASASYFSLLKKDFVLNIKGGVSTINAFDNQNVKLSDRKYLSSRRLRGFESYGIGPKDGKDHVGGNYSAYSTIQSTFPNPLPDRWNANSLVFIDAANVWGVDYDSSKDSDKIRSSYGLALDWISPLGPLSFVLAETISSAPGDKEEGFNFQLGSSF